MVSIRPATTAIMDMTTISRTITTISTGLGTLME